MSSLLVNHPAGRPLTVEQFGDLHRTAVLMRASVRPSELPTWAVVIYDAAIASGIKSKIKVELGVSFSSPGDMADRWQYANDCHVAAINAGLFHDGMEDEAYPRELCFYQQ